jgi:hypothetical protein
MQFQKLDPVFNMGVNVMRPPFNFEPKCRYTVLTREEWIRGPGTYCTVRRPVWYTEESRTLGGAAAREYGQSLGRRRSISLGKYATVFQVEIYVILGSAYEIQINDRPEKYS